MGTNGCGANNVGGDGINTSEQLNLRSGVQSASLISSLSYKLTDSVSMHVNFDYATGKSVTVGEEVADGQAALRLQRDNPFVSAALRAELDSRGLTSFGVGRSHFDFGRRTQRRERNTYTFEVGFDGKLGDWQWQIFGQRGEFDANTQLENDRINPNFFFAVDAIRDPATGQIVCRDAAARAAGCVPLNVLGQGVATPAALQYILHTTLQDLGAFQTVAGAQITGEAFSLPAGAVKVAAGVEYREEGLDIEVDGLSRRRQLFSGLGTENLSQNFFVGEAFGEFVVPVVADLPLMKSLELEAAIRASDYSTIGQTTTWRAGAVWALNDKLRLRFQRSESVRAPSLFELYAPETIARANVTDPCVGTLQGLTPNRRANCAALGIPSNFVDPRAADSEFIISGGNATLREEESESWTAGVVFQTDAPGGRLSASVDYWNIDIADAIQGLNIERIINGCVDSASINNEFCPLVTRESGSLGILQVRNFDLNLASLTATGIDFQIQYAFDSVPSLLGSEAARLSLALSGTRLLKREELGNALDRSTLTILDGEIGFPKTRLNLQARYVDGPLAVALSSRFISKVKLDVQMPREFWADDVNSVDSRMYHDLAAYYDFREGMQVDLAIRNLLNEEPPRTPQHIFGSAAFAGIGSGGLYDNIGRIYSVGFSFKY